MNSQSSPFFPTVELFRKLSAKVLAGSEEMIVWQLDQTQEFINRSSKQLHQSLSTAEAIQKPEDWPAAIGNGLRSAMEIGREYAISASDYQRESCQLWQRQALDAQKVMTESLDGPFSMFKPGAEANKHHPRHAMHRVAA